MRLDSFLVEHGYYESRARAASAVKAGKVKVDGRPISKPSFKVISDQCSIEAQQEHPWVSRGGLKIVHALDVFGVDVKEKIALDVGASTGGFTDVLIARGAAKVYAVDVGRDQLHPRLKNNPKIISMESTDARHLRATDFDPLPNLIVCDASFISAMKVLEQPMSIVGADTDLITLVKPQFEVGKKNIGKGGLVKNANIAKKSLDNVADWMKAQSWKILAGDVSPIKGGDGNMEYLLHARKT